MKGKIWADISLPEKIGQEVLSISYETKKNARLYVYARWSESFVLFLGSIFLGSFFSILMILGMTGLGLVSVIVFFIYQTQTNCRKEIFKCSTVFDSMQSVVHFWFRDLSDVWKSERSRNTDILLCVYDDACSHAVICTKYSEWKCKMDTAGLDFSSLCKCCFTGILVFSV